jgi:hypothetical protein
VQRYYGTAETGQFPDRLAPVNIKADVDLAGAFRPIREINNEIRRLTLGAYAPLRYVLPHKQAAYDEKYSTKISGGERFFRQVDREESLIHLLRVNILKRMESSVASFALTIERQLRDVEALLSKIDAHDDSVEELPIDDIDVDDPAFEALLVGRKVTQSAKLGMKPRSSRTCCSPISRTGTTRPVEIMIVGPKKRSSMKMPSA